jgi:DNA adenine methylase
VLDRKFVHSESAYYRARSRFNALLKNGRADTAEAAGLFYYLNRTGYNGLCRFNRSGGFNVPFGRHPRINYRYDFGEYRTAFAGWTFTNTHFSDVPLAPDDFVYADPPYDVEFTKYSKDGFTWDDQVATAEWLARHSGPVILSNQATPRILREYKRLGFHLETFEAPRKISCTGDRSPATEVLAILNLPV